MSKVLEGTSGSSITVTKIFEHPTLLNTNVKSPVAYAIPSSTVVEAAGDVFTNTLVSTTSVSTTQDLSGVSENYSVKVVMDDGTTYYGLVSSVSENLGVYTVVVKNTTLPSTGALQDLYFYSATVSVNFFTKTTLDQEVYNLTSTPSEDANVELLIEPGFATRINSMVWEYTLNIPENLKSFTGFLQWETTFTDTDIQSDEITIADLDTVVVISGGSSNPDDMISSVTNDDFTQEVATNVERPKRVRTRGVDGSEYEVEYENTADAIAKRQQAQASLIRSAAQATSQRTGGIYKQHRLTNSYVNDPVTRGINKNNNIQNTITLEQRLLLAQEEQALLRALELRSRGYI